MTRVADVGAALIDASEVIVKSRVTLPTLIATGS